MGKTTQVALSLQAVLEHPEVVPFFPVVLSNEEINDLDATLRKRLGLTWLSGDRPVSLSDEGLQWFADKLCFVTDSLERTDSVEATARQLERLRGVAKLLITCRPEAWSKAADHLLVEKADVTVLGLIGDTDVQNYLGIARPADVASRPYLRNPVFSISPPILPGRERSRSRAVGWRARPSCSIPSGPLARDHRKEGPAPNAKGCEPAASVF